MSELSIDKGFGCDLPVYLPKINKNLVDLVMLPFTTGPLKQGKSSVLFLQTDNQDNNSSNRQRMGSESYPLAETVAYLEQKYPFWRQLRVSDNNVRSIFFCRLNKGV